MKYIAIALVLVAAIISATVLTLYGFNISLALKDEDFSG